MMPNLVRYFLRTFVRLESLLLIGELSLLLPFTLISRLVSYRWDEYLPGKPAPVVVDICFRANGTPWILVVILVSLFVWDSRQDANIRPRGRLFVVTSLSIMLIYIALNLAALVMALTYRGSIWEKPPFGL